MSDYTYDYYWQDLMSNMIEKGAFLGLILCFIASIILAIVTPFTMKDEILHLDDITVKAGESATIDMVGRRYAAFGPEECHPFVHKENTVLVPRKPGVYTVVIIKETMIHGTKTYVTSVVCESKSILDEPLPTSLGIEIVGE